MAILLKLYRLIRRPTTTETITASLARMVSKLAEHAIDVSVDLEDHRARVRAAEQSVADAEEELRRANAARTKIAALLDD